MEGPPGCCTSAWASLVRRAGSCWRLQRRECSWACSLLWCLGFSMDGTLMQRPQRTPMLAALERLVLTESPSLDKARCDACADEIAELFQQRLGVSAIRH